MQFAQKDAAAQMRDQLAEIYRRRVIPLLDKYCSELSDPGIRHRIERLEIDLGELKPENLEEEFVQRADQEIRRALRQALPAKIPSRDSLRPQNTLLSNSVTTTTTSDSPKGNQASRTVSSPQILQSPARSLEILNWFLDTGTLPWWVVDPGPTLLQEIFEALQAHSPARLQELWEEVQTHPVQLQRFVHAFTDRQLAGLNRPTDQKEENSPALFDEANATASEPLSPVSEMENGLETGREAFQSLMKSGGEDADDERESPENREEEMLKGLPGENPEEEIRKLISGEESEEEIPDLLQEEGTEEESALTKIQEEEIMEDRMAEKKEAGPRELPDPERELFLELIEKAQQAIADAPELGLESPPLAEEESSSGTLDLDIQTPDDESDFWEKKNSASEREAFMELLAQARLAIAGDTEPLFPAPDFPETEAEADSEGLNSLENSLLSDEEKAAADLDAGSEIEIESIHEQTPAEKSSQSADKTGEINLSLEDQSQAGLEAVVQALKSHPELARFTPSQIRIAFWEIFKSGGGASPLKGNDFVSAPELIRSMRRILERERLRKMLETNQQKQYLNQLHHNLEKLVQIKLRPDLREKITRFQAKLNELAGDKARLSVEIMEQVAEAFQYLREEVRRANRPKSKARTRAKSQEEEAESRFSDSDSLTVYNAGLVLLSPYLSRFLENLGLVSERKFRDEASRSRALLILQYLVTGETESPEFMLPLNKILCGVPLSTPVETSLEIREEEIEGAEELLQAVIQNWSALGTISLPGFRQTFLQREGIIRAKDGNWLLHVEKLTHDILIDRIPWSFNIVKLPWMEAIMQVEW